MTPRLRPLPAAFCPLLLLLPAFAASADSSLRGPVSGFVLDGRSRSIRPINGIPGAALLGPPLDVPFRLKRAAFSKNGNFALVIAEDGGVLLVQSLRDPSPSATPISLAMADPQWVLLNATDSAAALYSDSTRQLLVLSGLPDSPTAGPASDLSSLRGTVASMALDAAGRCVLLGVADPDAGGVFSVCAGAPESALPRLLAPSPMPSATAYVNGGTDAMVADRLSNQILLVRNWKDSPETLVIATAGEGISTPVGLLLSADEKQLSVANAGSQSITVHDLTAASPPNILPVPVPPTKLERLSRQNVFLLNDVTDGPLYLLDETNESQVYFVPVE